MWHIYIHAKKKKKLIHIKFFKKLKIKRVLGILLRGRVFAWNMFPSQVEKRKRGKEGGRKEGRWALEAGK